MGFDAEIVRQVERRDFLKRWASHALVRLVRASTPGCVTTTAHGRASPCTTPTARSSTTATFAMCLNTNPYTYVGRRPFNAAPDATLDRGLAMLTFRTLDLVPLLGLAASALASGEHLRHSRHTDYRTDLAERARRGLRPVPLPGRRRLPRRDHRARVPPRTRHPRPRGAVARFRVRARRRARRGRR